MGRRGGRLHRLRLFLVGLRESGVPPGAMIPHRFWRKAIVTGTGASAGRVIDDYNRLLVDLGAAERRKEGYVIVSYDPIDSIENAVGEDWGELPDGITD